MIGRLAWAQLRAQRTHSLWMGSLLTLLVAVLAATVTSGATQATLGAESADLQGWSRQFTGGASVVPHGEHAAYDQVDFDALTEGLASSQDSDAVVIAFDSVAPGVPQDEDDFWTASNLWAVALAGSGARVPLTDGRVATEPGDVVVAADVARRSRLSIGDRLTVSSIRWAEAGSWVAVPHELRVVGIAASSSLPGYSPSLPQLYLSWAEVGEPEGLFAVASPGPGHAPAVALMVAWNGPSPDPQRAFTGNQEADRLTGFDLPPFAAAWIGAAATLLAAMLVMSFAVGRSQAAARAQWLATARALGARRRSVAGAAAVESLVLGGSALVVGLPLGVAAAQAQLTIARALTRDPFGPAWVSLHVALVPVAAVGALVASTIVAAMPAFWATRVSPTAALTPVGDLAEAELSRRVPSAWALLPAAAGAALTWWGVRPDGQPTVAMLGRLAFAVGGFALVIEALRRAVVTIGRLLARRRHPALATAGDDLVARPRQAVAAALLVAMAVGIATWWAGSVVYSSDGDGVSSAPHEFLSIASAYVMENLTGGVTIAVLAMGGIALQAVAAAIAVSHRVATRSEAQARGALGLSRSVTIASWWWTQWIAQAMGVVAGVVGGAVAFVATTDPVPGSGSSVWGWNVFTRSMAAGASYGAAVGVGLLLMGALAAWLTARASAGRMVEALAH